MAKARTVTKTLYVLFTTCFFFVILNFMVNVSPQNYTPSTRNSVDTDSENLFTNRHACKAMFSLLDVYKKQLIPRHFLDDPKWYLTDEVLQKTTLQLEKMMKMREEGVGPSTHDYKDLASVVPNLLYLSEQQSHTINASSNLDYESQSKRQSNLVKPSVILPLNMKNLDGVPAHHITQNDSAPTDHLKPLPEGKVVTYLQSTQGIFPFIPCRINQYSQENVRTCLNRRHQRDGMTISFMGDSKVRNIFALFLNMTNYLNYNVSYANKTVPLGVLYQDYSAKLFLHEDIDATSLTHPNFRVVSRFRRFWDIANLETSKEVLLLKEWASGRKPVPDLLIVGYTSWMLYLHTARVDYKTSVHLDVVHLLLQLHQVIVPLLKAVSLRTRVLVHADTRLRPFSKSSMKHENMKKNILFHDSLIDWSEMIFWHFMKSSKNYQKQMGHQSILFSHSKRVLQDFYRRTQNISLSPSSFISTNYKNKMGPEYSFANSRKDPRHTGLWWWDTTLVLNLATISECGKLHKLNLQNHPLYNDHKLRCRDHHHAGNSTNEVEVQMILNLLCNSAVKTKEEYCCS